MNPCPKGCPDGDGFVRLWRGSESRSVVVLLAFALCPVLLGCPSSQAAKTSDSGEIVESLPETRLRVRVDAVRLAALETQDRVTGTVRAFHRSTLTAEIQGRVLARSVEAGATVERDGVILRLEDSRFELERRRAEASLASARTVLRHAERELARGDRLLREKAISTQRHDDLGHAVDRARDEFTLAEVTRDTAKRNLADTRIAAPFAGTVDSVSVDVGDFVAPGTPVATLVDLSKVRIFAGVTASEAARLVPGTKARVSFSDLGGETLEATLESVARVASAGDGTYAVELWMDDPLGRMRDGLVAQVEIPDPDAAPRLLARRTALLRRNGHPELFIVEGVGDDAVVRTRQVRTGRSEGEWVEILEGVQEGERVVWEGQFALADGVSVVVDGEG